MDNIQGIRIYEPKDENDFSDASYGFLNKMWYVKIPGQPLGVLRAAHTVTEHEDGTITVWPSMKHPVTGWHGWLKRGIFTEDYHSVA